MADIQIPKKAKVRVYWDTAPENYSTENKNKIIAHYQKKYDIDKKNINVVFRPVKINDKGEAIIISGAAIDNIMDVQYQRDLMKEWLEREKKEVDLDRVFKLDDSINSGLNLDLATRNYRSWKLRHIWINNFLCFGDDNSANIDELSGFNVVDSLPKNTGGKTTFIVDAPQFLFFGTTTKTSTNSEIFNTFSTNNELSVKGLVEIDGQDYIIERSLTRTAKKDGSWSVKSKVKYYEILPDGQEKDLNPESENKNGLEEENSIQTTNKIVEAIGTEDDFNTTILTTARNVEELIDAQATARGKLFTRFIGLEVIEKKDELAKSQYSEFKKKMKSNHFNTADLSTEIEKCTIEIENSDKLLVTYNDDLLRVKDTTTKLNEDKEALINKKHKIDEQILSMNPAKLETEMKDIKDKGEVHRNNIKTINTRLEEIGVINFDEDNYVAATKEKNSVNTKKSINENDISRINKLIKQLKEGEICPTCKRALADVDHSKEISDNEDKVVELTEENALHSVKITELTEEITALDKVKKLIDEKNTLELNRDRIDVNIASLINEFKSKDLDLKNYKLNTDAINTNREIDTEISMVNTKIKVSENERDVINRTIQKTKESILKNQGDIKDKTVIIEQIKKEDEIEKIYKIYLELVGKKGISKLILRSVIPIINSELQRLLDETCDFEIELNMTDKNEIEFLLIRDGVIKSLKSGSGLERTAAAIALRCVLGKISNLPKPNFIVFDEVLGKVAAENFDSIKLLFDKIKDMYETVFLITHNDTVRDWSDNIITIKKENNISTIKL